MNARILTLEQQMLSLVSGVFDAHTAALFLPDESEEGVCRLAAAFSLGDAVASDAVARKGQGLVGWILGERKPLEVPMFNPQTGGLPYYQEGGDAEIGAFMGCPLPSGGVLCVDARRQHAFGERELKHLKMFAAILDGIHSLDSLDSLATESPRLFSRLEELHRLRGSYRLWAPFIAGFLKTVAAASGFEYCAFACVETPDESYTVNAENVPTLVRGGEPFYQSLAYGIAGWVLRNGQPVVQTGESDRAPALFGTSENLPDFAAVACLPVVVNRGTWGCLCLGHSEPRPLSLAMRSFLDQACGLLSAHLEALRLRMRLQDAMQQARVYTDGPRAHNPDTDPYRPVGQDREG